MGPTGRSLAVLDCNVLIAGGHEQVLKGSSAIAACGISRTYLQRLSRNCNGYLVMVCLR